jgi:hypothetical protein
VAGDCAGIVHQLEDKVVDLLRRDPRHYVRHERVENLGGEAARRAHAGEACRPVQLDRARALRGRNVIAVDRLILRHGREYRA